jgi:exopolyphosphatase/guanosine-5'-triphosphate,3'-diphosphate pyrophosphatase
MRRRGVTRSRLVATEACRKAVNCDEFLARVAAETGLVFEILSNGEEANLAVAGCTPLIDRRVRYALVFDIGGGSTELIWLAVRRNGLTRLLHWTSLPCGVVTLAERYGGGDIPPAVYRRMIEEVDGYLAGFRAAVAADEPVRRRQVQVLGTSGTVTTLGGVRLDLPFYDRNRVDGLWLSFDDALGIAERLRGMSLAQRAEHPCIGRERADLVVAGCAILEAICRAWPVGRLRVADRGLREGMLLSMMQAADRETGQG